MAAESGHAPSRVYTDQSGNFHQNGASIYVSNETTALDTVALTNGPSGNNGATDGMFAIAHWIGTYDFAVLGGATGTLNIAATLPYPCAIIDGIVYVDTAVTSSGSATVALGVQTTTDLLAATGKASLSLGAFLPIIPDPASAAGSTTAVLTDSSHNVVQVTIATAALTAGKFRVILRLVPTP